MVGMLLADARFSVLQADDPMLVDRRQISADAITTEIDGEAWAATGPNRDLRRVELRAAEPGATPTTVPADTPEAVERVVGAVNAGDVDAFADQFAPGGSFATRGYFTEGEWYGFGLFGDRLDVDEAPLVDAWFAINDAWGFEAELRSCTVDPDGGDDAVECEVAVRWRTLSLEITEGWDFSLEGDEITWWGASPYPEHLELLDLDPPARSLPLGYADIEAWEAWLASNHPEDASRWLNRRNAEQVVVDAIDDPELAARVAPLLTPAQESWVIDGHEFTPFGLIPYDPQFADEIRASIEEFLATR
jgi:hypothetical protein